MRELEPNLALIKNQSNMEKKKKTTTGTKKEVKPKVPRKKKKEVKTEDLEATQTQDTVPAEEPVVEEDQAVVMQ